jgi:hypothetical protein
VARWTQDHCDLVHDHVAVGQHAAMHGPMLPPNSINRGIAPRWSGAFILFPPATWNLRGSLPPIGPLDLENLRALLRVQYIGTIM